MNKFNVLLLILTLTNCSYNKLEEKGFPVNLATDNKQSEKNEGISKDSLIFETRPSNVLLTGISNVRLTTVFKVNVNKRDGTKFIGANNYHYLETGLDKGNNWNGNLMPGLAGVYGYNLVNISHYDIKNNTQKNFFEKPVLIKTLYYPSFSKDTLNFNVVNRNYFLISVYNDDTNKDSMINQKDLRRFYLYNLNGEKQKEIVPENYSVFKSEYDPANDFMYIFAQLDLNKNGQIDDNEPTNIFYIDLKNPVKTGQQY